MLMISEFTMGSPGLDMVTIKCAKCEHVIEKKPGLYCNTVGLVCPKCGHDGFNVKIGIG